MMESNTNTVNAVQDEVVDVTPAESPEILPEKPEQNGANRPEQSPAANKSFARLRKERDRLAKALAEIHLTETKPEENTEGGPAQAGASSAEDADFPDLPETNEPSELETLRRENETLAEMLYESQFERDIRQLHELFPGEKAAHVSDLGADFLALRAAGVDNLTAYVAVRLAGRMAKPPEAGAVASSAAEEGGFFSSREIDLLTEKEMNDPKVLQKAIQSMTKWR